MLPHQVQIGEPISILYPNQIPARYSSPMEIRPMTPGDLDDVHEIDATVESAQYLHVDRAGEGLAVQWKIEPRPFREKRTRPHRLDDEQQFTLKQIVNSIDEGIALVAVHDGKVAGSATARQDFAAQTLRIIDLRVDFDFRRQGLASALLFQMIQECRQRELRALTAQTTADNFPAADLLAKLGFQLAGLDTHHRSNHDLVKEAVTLFWYLTWD